MIRRFITPRTYKATALVYEKTFIIATPLQLLEEET